MNAEKSKARSKSGTSRQEAARAEQKPWAWILLSFIPLLILNDLYLSEYPVKVFSAAAILAIALFMLPMRGKKSPELKFSLPELYWSGYFLLGIIALAWSKVPVLGFERLAYLSIGIAGYIVAKQTKFWKSALYWHCFAAVALLVSIIGTMNFLFAGTSFGFDWIPSAGKPSSTLGYRSYAASYLAFSIPVLFWYIFSDHAQQRIFRVLGSAALVTSLGFLIQTRARSEWIGTMASCAIMTIVLVSQAKFRASLPKVSLLKYGAIPVAAILILAALPASRQFNSSDKSAQQLANTDKQSVGSTLRTMFRSAATGNFDRMQYWRTGMAMMFDRSLRGRYEGPLGMRNFLWGVGMGQFPTNAMLYNSGSTYHLYVELHNDWLQALIELGPLGFLCISGFMLSLLYYAWRIRQQGIGIACIGVLTAWLFSTQFDFALPKVYCMLAVAGVAAILHEEASIPDFLRIKKAPLLRFAPVPGGLWMLYIATAFMITMYWDRQMYRSMVYQDQTVDAVYKRMADTSSVFSYYNGHGKFMFSPVLEEIMAQAQKSYEQYPPANSAAAGSDIRLSMVEWLAGDLLRWNPDNINYMQRMAAVSFIQRKFDNALPYADRILEQQADNTTALTIKISSLAQLGKEKEAAEIMKSDIVRDTKRREHWKRAIPSVYRHYIADF